MKTATTRAGIYGNFDVLIYENGKLIDCLTSCAATIEEAQIIADKVIR